MNKKEKEDFFEHDNLSDEEKEKAKQNGFILVGKTGTGKTTILNAIFNKVVGKAVNTAKSVTKITSIYYYKLKNGNVISLVDTPGLADSERTENKNIDKMHLDGITKAISKEKIHIKGILFLINFQNKRFDADEQEALLNYNTLFPLKNFWKCVVIVYSHFFADPNDDFDEEEMKNERRINNSKIFKELMEKVKAVSDTISYDDLKIKYFNSYSEATNNKKKKSNDRTRDELEVIFDELSKNSPLFCQVEIKHIKNHKWKENGKEYIGEVEIIGFFDLNKEPIKEIMNIIKKEEVIKHQNYSPPSYNYYVYKATRSPLPSPDPKPLPEPGGIIVPEIVPGTIDNSKYLQAANEGGTIGAIIGGTFTAVAGLLTYGSLVVAGPAVVVGTALGYGIGAVFGYFSKIEEEEKKEKK